jgi:hypothetical protein
VTDPESLAQTDEDMNYPDREDDPAAEAQRLTREAAQLREALASARMIGAAIGIVMKTEGKSYEAAFDRLRHISQVTNCKIRVLAERAVWTGEVPSLIMRTDAADA